jgi:hypothetical protein
VESAAREGKVWNLPVTGDKGLHVFVSYAGGLVNLT